MTKTQTIEALATKFNLTKALVKDLLEEMARLAIANAKDGFDLPGLGKLVLSERKPRVGRNPATGEKIDIPAKTVVKFRVSKACKEAVLASSK